METEPTKLSWAFNKNTLLWLLIRLSMTVLIITGCLSLISMANTVAVIAGYSGLLGALYYWLPTKEQFDNYVNEIGDFFDED